MIVLKKIIILPEEARRWLFECEKCHSETLFAAEDFENYTYPDMEHTTKILRCPVCGKTTYDLDDEWIRRGYVKDIYANAGELFVVDNDGTRYKYSSVPDEIKNGNLLDIYKEARG